MPPSCRVWHHDAVRAIVFDFFGTLTARGAEAGRRASFTATAAALGVPAESFWREMGASFPERIVGRHGGTRTTLRAIARRCGAEPTGEQLDAAGAAQLGRAPGGGPPPAGGAGPGGPARGRR